ncbi:fructokinase [Paraoerskovia marina]|uniref:Fructokinase n=1 Tax=Paraoerskovia marina TaxID=545619 RepID=A0A1H1URM7_9CELL|nr:carbohydrate kinase [Paraoerskovia marina]SDS75107.1 fructokinase [Paraoerskovia marina]
MSTRAALVVGEVLVDIVRRPDGTVSEHPGGSPANVAIALGRLGRPVDLATWMGHGAYGDLVSRWLTKCGVGLVDGSDGALETSVATAALDDDGEATYRFDVAFSVPRGAHEALSAATPCVHAGSIAALDARAHGDVVSLLTESRPNSTVSFDPNVRPALMGDPAEAARRADAIVDVADVVKASDSDLSWLFPGTDPIDAARRWVGRGPSLVVVTLGDEGAVALTPEHTVRVAGVPVDVVDTVGAGDAFMGALIDGLWERDLLGAGHRQSLRRAGAEVIEGVLTHCTRAAALTVTRRGAQPPTRAELENW